MNRGHLKIKHYLTQALIVSIYSNPHQSVIIVAKFQKKWFHSAGVRPFWTNRIWSPHLGDQYCDQWVQRQGNLKIKHYLAPPHQPPWGQAFPEYKFWSIVWRFGPALSPPFGGRVPIFWYPSLGDHQNLMKNNMTTVYPPKSTIRINESLSLYIIMIGTQTRVRKSEASLYIMGLNIQQF